MSFSGTQPIGVPAPSSVTINVLTSGGFDLLPTLAGLLAVPGTALTGTVVHDGLGGGTFSLDLGLLDMEFGFVLQGDGEITLQEFDFYQGALHLAEGTLDVPYFTGVSDFADLSTLASVLPVNLLASYAGAQGDDSSIALGAFSQAAMFGGNDSVLGNDGIDFVMLNSGNDVFNGLGGADVSHGGSGNDLLIGGLGNDTLRAGVGNDVLVLNGDRDIASGGAGRDTFILDAEVSGVSIIGDFDPAQDVLVFAGLPTQPGAVSQGGDLSLANWGQGDFRGGFNVATTGSGALRITWGDHTTVLRGVAAADLSENNLFWNSDGLNAALAAFEAPGTVGIGLNGDLFTMTGPGGDLGIFNSAIGLGVDSFQGDLDFLI